MWLELRVDIGDILRQLFAFLGLSSLRGALSLAGHFCELHVQLNSERKPIIIGHLATGRAVV
jgi:predicted DNA-binding protein with PD1-like motif